VLGKHVLFLPLCNLVQSVAPWLRREQQRPDARGSRCVESSRGRVHGATRLPTRRHLTRHESGVARPAPALAKTSVRWEPTGPRQGGGHPRPRRAPPGPNPSTPRAKPPGRPRPCGRDRSHRPVTCIPCIFANLADRPEAAITLRSTFRHLSKGCDHTGPRSRLLVRRSGLT
jgi:hypothetical protein